jgi:pimeloyl-ACP methyl ester carboxylesterase
MGGDRIHRVVSDDGTEIAARVHGQGPPLLLLPAGPGDGETCWGHLVPYLSDRFTCYPMDARGRGRSGPSTDFSPTRLAEDVVAFARSLGDAVGMVGWGSSHWALVAADHPAVVRALVAYEPGANEVLSEADAARLEHLFSHVGERVAQGRLDEAAQTFIAGSEAIYSAVDLADGAPAAFWTASAGNLPSFLEEEQQAAESEAPGPTDPSVLERITAPLLLLQGTRTRPWFGDSVHHVAEHVADARVREVPGAGHFGPHTAPEAVAGEILRFLDAVEPDAAVPGWTTV